MFLLLLNSLALVIFGGFAFSILLFNKFFDEPSTQCDGKVVTLKERPIGISLEGEKESIDLFHVIMTEAKKSLPKSAFLSFLYENRICIQPLERNQHLVSNQHIAS